MLAQDATLRSCQRRPAGRGCSNRSDDQPLAIRRQFELRLRCYLEQLQNGLVDDDTRAVPMARSRLVMADDNIVITSRPGTPRDRFASARNRCPLPALRGGQR